VGISQNAEAGGRVLQTLGRISYTQKIRMSRYG